ncbi:CATRA conflict system CASPASE/TPR repeat-associated protein [Streptomyces sp. NPDC058872]|uniref:CATRA conflict system CASPASE/TPR repeat-associated protein n=1 Tax=Streptomyces sp. NPDC058872 TaxID=3346661 RepID=UPI00369C0640
MSARAPLRQALVARLLLSDAALVEGTPARALLRRWWNAAASLGMVDPVGNRPSALPTATGTPQTEPQPRLLAAVQRTGPAGADAYEMLVVVAVHDMIAVSVLLAPNDATSDWAGLAARWWGTAGRLVRPATGLLGSSEQLLAELPPAAATLDADAVTSWLMPAVPAPTPKEPSVTVGKGGAIRLWELSVSRDWWTGHRRQLAVAAEADAEALSLWSWQGVRAGAPAATVHLLMAARIRQHCDELRITTAPLWDLADRVGRACREVAVVDDTARDGRGVPAAHVRLHDLETALASLETVRQEVAMAVLRLRRLDLDVAGAEETLHLLGGEEAELAAPELRRVRWARAQNRTLAEVLALADGRADAVARRSAATADRLTRTRRDRLTLSQTSILGSLLMMLAAIQSLNYEVPLPGPVQPSFIAFLTSLALVLPWLAQPRRDAVALRAFGRGFDLFLFAALGAGAGWLLASSMTFWLASSLPVPFVVVVCALVAVGARAWAFRGQT